MELFSQGQANRILKHIPYTTTREWAKAGLFQWHDGPQDGRGRHRLYSRLNLYQIYLCDILLKNTNLKSNYLKGVVENFFAINNDESKAIANFDYYMVITMKGSAMQMFLCNEDEIGNHFISPLSYNIVGSVINLKLLKEGIDAAIKNDLE